jgi:hypothetical protein
MERQGKFIILIGVLICIAGLIGRLPGDIRIDRGNVKIFIPITSMILASLLLTLLSWIVQKIAR